MGLFAPLLLLVAVTNPTLSSAAGTPDHTIFRTSAMVENGSTEKDGTLWFTTAGDQGARFILHNESASAAGELRQLLSMSLNNSRSVDVTFDAAMASFNPQTATIDFPVCSVKLDETVFTSRRKCVDQQLSPKKLSSSPVLAIAMGWAEIRGGSKLSARDLENQALHGEKPIPPALQSAALLARAEANDAIGYDEDRASAAGDEAFSLALADYRKLAELQPDNVEYRFAQGYDREQLGDYLGAGQLYDLIMTKWPAEKYRVTIRKSAVARFQGDYERSLELLNSLVPDFGPDPGMKFYYHRGWTLSKLGRLDEAIADFTNGFKSQADYPSAFLRRGCAYAGVGKLDFAIGDFETAANLIEQSPTISDSSDSQRHLKFTRAAVIILKRAVQAARNEPVPSMCEGDLWDAFDKPRLPSPLLLSDN